jgi:hypothetical protein
VKRPKRGGFNEVKEQICLKTYSEKLPSTLRKVRKLWAQNKMSELIFSE